MNKQKILVIGASGFIGKEIFKKTDGNLDVVGTCFGVPENDMLELDITDEKESLKVLNKVQPDVILHLAAVTDVDLCEREPSKAHKVNVEATSHLVEWSKESNARYLYFSTDFVFDGTEGNYNEEDKVNPINVYGKTKLEAEKIVQRLDNHLILRLSTPYGFGKTKKFVNYFIENLMRGKEVFAAKDLRRSPTFIEDIANNITFLIGKNVTGVLNFAGDSHLSVYQMAEIIAKKFDVPHDLVKETTSEKLAFDAKRPLNTTLDITKLKELGISMKGFEEGLACFKS